MAHLVLLDLSACSESFDISISLMASLTSSFSTVSIMRRRACARATKQRREVVFLPRDKRTKERADWRFRLRCAGTVRPRQVQCPLGWLAIAQVSASQHQLVSSGQGRGVEGIVMQTEPTSLQFLRWDGDSSGHSQLCMGLHSCC